MRRILLTAVYLLMTDLTTNSLNGQQPGDRVAVTGGVVEAYDASGTSLEPRQLLSEGEKIRTAGASFASLVIGDNGNVMVGEKSEIEIRRLGNAPVIWVERGNVKLTSQSADIRILTKSGLFSGAEWPYAFELTKDAETINLVVTEGAVRPVYIDSAAVTFRAPGNTGYRTYVVGGGATQIPEPPATLPNVFVQSCIGVPSAAPSPTPNPSPTKPGTNTTPPVRNHPKPELFQR